MVRVLMASGTFYPDISGGALVQWKLSKKAVEAGHELTVVSVDRENNSPVETVEGVEIRRPFPARVFTPGQNSPVDLTRKAIFALFLCVYLPYLARKQNVDVVYSAAHVCHPGSKVAGLVNGLPVVNFVGYTPSVGTVRRRLGYILRLLERVNFRLFLGQSVFCRTPTARDALTKYTDGRVEIIHGVVNSDVIEAVEFDTDLDIELPGKPQLVWVGRLVEIKQPKAAIEVLDQLPSSFGLTIVGDGPQMDQTRTLVQKRGLQDRVRFCGQCSHKETLRTIAAADALVLTSRTEAYPTVVFEALALRRNAFATPVGVLPEINHPRLRLSEVDELAEKIETSELPGEMGIDKEALEAYSMDRYAETMLEEWEALTVR